MLAVKKYHIKKIQNERLERNVQHYFLLVHGFTQVTSVRSLWQVSQVTSQHHWNLQLHEDSTCCTFFSACPIEQQTLHDVYVYFLNLSYDIDYYLESALCA